jgi:hypothetical protein
MQKKVREAQLAQYNYILVVGEAEKAERTVNVRTRDNKVHGELSVDEVIKRFGEMNRTKTNQAEEEFGLGGGSSRSSGSSSSSRTSSDGARVLTEADQG